MRGKLLNLHLHRKPIEYLVRFPAVRHRHRVFVERRRARVAVE